MAAFFKNKRGRGTRRPRLLLRRHRFVTDTWGWEIPAGRVDPGETLEQAAERESIEETGWRPLGLERLGFSHPTNGLMEQRFEYFVSSSAERVGAFADGRSAAGPWHGRVARACRAISAPLAPFRL